MNRMAVALALAGFTSGMFSWAAACKPREKLIGELNTPVPTIKFETTVTSVLTQRTVGSGLFVSHAPDGATYVTVLWRYKNISDKPMGSFSVPIMKLVDPHGTALSADMSASSNYAVAMKRTGAKVLSDLNPGVGVDKATVFEVGQEQWQRSGWKLAIRADEDVEIPVK